MSTFDAEQFRQAMRQLPALPKSQPPHWDHWQGVLRDWILDENNDPADFFRCPAVYHTMLVNHWVEAIQYEFAQLPHEMRIQTFMPELGHDYMDKVRSRNLVHQLYHLHRWQEVTGKKVKDLDEIVEFGGGYGAMCLVARRLGFDGRYIIFDLPEFTLLQRFFLSNVNWWNIEVIPKVHDKPTEFYDNIDDLWNNIYEPDLLIACYSLSETPLDFRQIFLDNMTVDNYLFLFSNRFADYDNLTFFRRFADKRDDLKWTFEKIEHLPPESWYAFGNKA